MGIYSEEVIQVEEKTYLYNSDNIIYSGKKRARDSKRSLMTLRIDSVVIRQT